MNRNLGLGKALLDLTSGANMVQMTMGMKEIPNLDFSPRCDLKPLQTAHDLLRIIAWVYQNGLSRAGTGQKSTVALKRAHHPFALEHGANLTQFDSPTNSATLRHVMNMNKTFVVCTLLLTSLLTGCANSPSDPKTLVVNGLQNKIVASDRPTVTPGAKSSNEISVTASVDKNALLSQEFLYGADLQYSSLYDKSMDLYQQSLAIGHIPARFRIVGDELQLVADNKRLYPSEVNHPEQLLSRFKILGQTDSTLTITGANSGVFLAEIFGGLTSDTATGLTDQTAKPPRDLWIRSFDFVPQGNYLLQQTSVVLDDGSISEFMESIFPRSTLQTGAQFEKFEMNPDSATGGSTSDSKDALKRFRFLPGEADFQGEHKFAMAEHFDISQTPANPTGTIDWYVTPNITDEEITPVQLAVEGWNRYFKSFNGIQRKVVRFMGRLPEGIHLGDPRYNVINWDSRLVAGAAYETQATDPSTGKQSHSLIYMPAAWLQIGFDYWKNGLYSEQENESVAPASLARIGGAMKASRLSCLRDMRAAGALLASGRIAGSGDPKKEIKEFGIKLLKDTLFHEVGHSLGLAHNFKGSLSFDRTDPKSMFSTSIMDYNDYEIELAAFSAIDSSDGPLLEYDRQAIDRIYNRGADISDNDPMVPTCNDAEADNESGGVDPLCIRYDIEKDPTLSIGTALDRITLATKAGDFTLTQAVNRVASMANPQDDLKALTQQLSQNINGAMQFYLLSGKASLAKTLRLNAKSLLQFADGILPKGYDEKLMRERAFDGVQKALAMTTLPDSVKAALAQIEAQVDQSLKLPDDLKKSFHTALFSIETDESGGLPKLRSLIYASLARHKAVPYFFGTLPGEHEPMDLEASLTGILGDAVAGSGKTVRTASERLAAAKALATFAGRPLGNEAISAVQKALLKARAQATNNASRELTETLLQTLGVSDSPE